MGALVHFFRVCFFGICDKHFLEYTEMIFTEIEENSEELCRFTLVNWQRNRRQESS